MLRLKNIGGITSVVLFIITASIAFVILFTPLYHFSVWVHDLPEQLGMSHGTIARNYYSLLQYLHVPWITELNMPDFPSSVNGAFHMWEVKILFYINYGILMLSAIGSFAYSRYLKRNRKLWVLERPFFIAALLPPVFLTLLAINFDRMFVVFHQLFFNNEHWIFNPVTDPIILALPQEFFMYCFIVFFLLVEGAFIFIYRYSKKNGFK